jgi:HSP20 family protein
MFNYFNNSNRGLFDEFRRLEREMDQFLSTSPTAKVTRTVTQGTYPPVNIGTTDERVDIYLFAPALDLEKLDISIHQNQLTIKGSRKQEERSEATKIHRRERNYADFQRLFTLPEDVDQDKVDASYRDGVLHITVHRKESSKPRQITIN